MGRPRHIFVMIHSDPFNSSAILRGVGEYARRKGNWSYTVFSGQSEIWSPRSVVLDVMAP